MLVQITHLKAPWPAGAGVGEVVEVPGDSIPGCFVGKCVPAEDGATAAHVFVPTPPPAVLAETKIAAPEGANDDALREAQALLLAEREHTADLLAAAERLQAQVLELTVQRDEALAKAEQAVAELAAASTKTTGKARA